MSDSLVFIGLFGISLAAMPATPALASSGSFSTTGSMNVARDGQTATLLQNGQVLVVYGESFHKSAGALRPIASAELYTP